MAIGKNISKLLLCGFMGSGKSTLSKRLVSRSEGWRAIDLDDFILENEGKSRGYASLGELIRNEGWDFFRDLETEYLKSLLFKKEKLLISLGGGSVTDENLDLIQSFSDTALVWLDTPFEECWQRIKEDTNRPLVQQSQEEVEEIYLNRLPLYEQSDGILTPVQQNILTNVEELLELLRKMDE